jgi:hypothetical protein
MVRDLLLPAAEPIASTPKTRSIQMVKRLITSALFAALFALPLALTGCATGSATGTETMETEPMEAADAAVVPGSVVDEEILEDGLDPERPAEEQPEAMAQMEPEYEWFVDDEGRRYRVERLKKKKGQFRRLEDDQIRTVWGIIIFLEDEDDEYFYYKVFDTTGIDQPVQNTGPTQAELAAQEASYRVDVGDTNRLIFKPWDAGLPNRGQWRNGFRLVDMNGDGRLDLVHGAQRKPPGRPVIYLNQGDGQWAPWQEMSLPRFPYDYGDVVVGDWNGDGINDLAFAMHLRGITALIGDGKGGFELWNEGLEFVVPGRGQELPGFTSRALETLDWNDDGRPDLVALGEGPHLMRGGKGLASRAARGVTIYLNQGDGSWETLPLSDARDQVFGDDLTVADLNGDGHEEVITSSHLQGQRGIVFEAGGEEGWTQTVIDQIRPRAYLHSTAVADFNEDGRNDLALGYMSWGIDAVWRSGVDVFLQTEGGKWERSTLRVKKDSVKRTRSLAAGDIDGDGHVDLVGATEEGTVEIYLGNGRGGFFREAGEGLRGPGGNCAGYHVEVRDLDGDGMSEIVAAFAGEQSGIVDLKNCPTGGSLQAWKPLPASMGK